MNSSSLSTIIRLSSVFNIPALILTPAFEILSNSKTISDCISTVHIYNFLPLPFSTFTIVFLRATEAFPPTHPFVLQYMADTVDLIVLTSKYMVPVLVLTRCLSNIFLFVSPKVFRKSSYCFRHKKAFRITRRHFFYHLLHKSPPMSDIRIETSTRNWYGEYHFESLGSW